MAVLTIQLPEGIKPLVSESALERYTTGQTSQAVQAQLREVTHATLFPAGVVDREQADCCLSGLWLLHNFLDQSHEISQSLDIREGSYWHGIMHRLEQDFWNSKYWYRKVGNHPVFDLVAAAAGLSQFAPDSFVDQCEASVGGFDAKLHTIAQAEWIALFEYCYQQARA